MPAVAKEYVVFIVEAELNPFQVTVEQWTSVMKNHRAYAGAVAAAEA